VERVAGAKPWEGAQKDSPGLRYRSGRDAVLVAKALVMVLTSTNRERCLLNSRRECRLIPKQVQLCVSADSDVSNVLEDLLGKDRISWNNAGSASAVSESRLHFGVNVAERLTAGG